MGGRSGSLGGESKDDVAARARRFLEEVVMPYVWAEDAENDDTLAEEREEERRSDDSDVLAAQVVAEQKAKAKERKEKRQAHICVVSHGLFIPELIVLMAMKDEEFKTRIQEVRSTVKGMRNTDWTRIEFGFKVSAIASVAGLVGSECR